MKEAKAQLRRHGLRLVREVRGGQPYEYYPLSRFVVIAPGICGGRPTFKGTRVEVRTILDWLRAGRGLEDVLKSYPSVSLAAAQEAIKLATRALNKQYSLQAA